MTIDPHRDYTREEQLALDLPALLGAGLRGDDGELRLELQGVGTAALALQAEAAGVPLPMYNRMLTTANEVGLQLAAQRPEVLVEELEKRGFAQIGRVVRAGVAACRDEEEYRLLVRWLIQARNLMALRAREA